MHLIYLKSSSMYEYILLIAPSHVMDITASLEAMWSSVHFNPIWTI